MARIQLKQQRRYRVQISISKGLWEHYNDNLKLANQLKAEIDFSKDFEVWFGKQNEQVAQELKRLLDEQQAGKLAAEKKGGDHYGDN